MQIRQISHQKEMQQKIKAGIQEIASIVARTLGPAGLPIMIERLGQQPNGEPLGPLVTKDGVTVASYCSDPDPEIDLVIQGVKAICQKTNKVAGDGTTTAIVLGQAIFNEALKYLEAHEKLNPQQLRSSLEEASKGVQETLQGLAHPCKTLEQMEAIATISANGDQNIGSVIRGAFEAVGAEGTVTVDEGGSAEHTLDVVQGFQFRRGAEAQDRFYNNSERTKYEAEDVHVIIYDGKIITPEQVVGPLQMIYEASKATPPVLFIANEFTQEALQLLLINRAERGLALCAVKGPHQTNVRTAMYDDLAVYLGGTRMGNGNKNLANLTMDDIGFVRRVVVDKYSTTLYDGAGSDDLVLERIDQLKAQRAQAESPYDAALLSDRLAGLSEGIAKIGVGGKTEMEVKEAYHRIEDAVNASRAAVEAGVIPGGGATLYRIGKVLEAKPDKTIGESILAVALQSPLNQILANLGYEKTEAEEKALLTEENSVFDGVSLKVVNAMEAGIIDPVKVTQTALGNAVSIAALLSTCGGAIVLKRKLA